MIRGGTLVFFAIFFAGAFAQLPAYVGVSSSYPWFSSSYADEFTNVFGPEDIGWEHLDIEVDAVGTILDPARTFIRLEGSDGQATEMETWFLANQVAVENWVSAGGSLYFNVAPNEDNGFDMGFGGHPLILRLGDNADVPMAQSGSDLFTTPNTVVQSYTGNSASHAYVEGTGTCYLEDEGSDCTLRGFTFGNGFVMLGGLTSSDYWQPQSDAIHLQENTLVFVGNAAGMGGDPHIFGFDGSDTDLYTADGAVVNAISDRDIQVNIATVTFPEVAAAFTSFIGQIGFQTASGDTIVFDTTNSEGILIVINGEATQAAQLPDVTGTSFSIKRDAVAQRVPLHLGKALNTPTMSFAVDFDRYSFRVFIMDSFWPAFGIEPRYLDFTVRLHGSEHTPTGVLGRTVHAHLSEREVEPLDVNDYLVADGILGSQFKLNQFAA